MRSFDRNPAIYAGLLGVGLWADPVPAYALQVSLAAAESPFVKLGVGLVAGAALSGAVIIGANLVGDFMASRSERMEQEREAAKLQKDLIPVPELGNSGQVATAQKQDEAPVAKRAGRHMRGEANPRMVKAKAEGSKAVGRHAAPSGVAKAASAKASGRHARPAAHFANASSNANAARKDSDDLAEVAEKYVEESRKKRFGSMTGVGRVLADRLMSDMFDDLPVISRADGSVGDVGTDWWNNFLGSSVRTVSDIDFDALDEEPISLVTATGSEAHVSAVSSASMAKKSSAGMRASELPVPGASRMTDGAKRSAYISKSVAEVNLGMYPEKRTAEALDEDDLWAQALKAMGERIEREHGAIVAPVPVFDEAAAPLAVDIAEGELEGSTNFIPFKKPAGHPEVVDASSYVDYLIDEEFSKNASPAARKSSRDYLRVIQGGSQRSKPLQIPRRKAYVPKHFSRERVAV